MDRPAPGRAPLTPAVERIVLAAPGDPRVSVLIPAWRRAGLLRACLRSLARHRSVHPFETIVLLNGATPEVRSVLAEEVEGARVVSSRVNLGFGGGCNRAARAAQGEFLVLLNDDTEVQDGWLDALVETADAHPDAGAVGSRIVSHDGLLLEAGGLVWREGVSSHLGRGLPESTDRHRFARWADYCSASSLLVRRSTWDAVGGFDDGYFPGYYEDVDLCLSIAHLGQRIRYQPRSCVRHYESGSLDWDSPYKHFVSARSQRRFIAKWGAALDRFPALPQTFEPWARDIVDERALLWSRHAHRRVLVVDPEGSRAEVVVTQLLGRDTTVSVFTDARPDPDRFSDLGVEVFVGDLARHLSRPTVLYDAVVMLHPVDVAVLRALQPQATLLYDSDDARADVLALATGSPLTEADRVVCHSAFDASLLAMVPGGAPVSMVDGASRSLAGAIAATREDKLRKRSLDRRSGAPPR